MNEWVRSKLYAMKISLRILCRHAVLCWYFKRIFRMLLEHLLQHKRIIRMQHIFLSTFIYKFMTCLLLLASSSLIFTMLAFHNKKVLENFSFQFFFFVVVCYSRGKTSYESKVGGRKTIFTEEIVWNLWTFMLSSFITLHVSLCKFQQCSSTKRKEGNCKNIEIDNSISRTVLRLIINFM